MKVLDLEVIGYDKENDAYHIKYSLLLNNGVIRRSRAIYSKRTLSRDKDNKELLSLIADKVKSLS